MKSTSSAEILQWAFDDPEFFRDETVEERRIKEAKQITRYRNLVILAVVLVVLDVVISVIVITYRAYGDTTSVPTDIKYTTTSSSSTSPGNNE